MGDSDNEHPSKTGASPAGSGVFSLGPGVAAGRGRYVLERELGQGGMGVVWLALDLELNEQVALKFVPPEIRRDADALDELRRETQKSRRLTHPNILRIHDFVRSEGEPPFISMEFVEGTTLSALKAEQPERVFPWETLKPLVTQLCQALAYAHGEGVVHRDLKPANMMLDARGRLKLADFGLAATISDSMSRVSFDRGISGTPAYMSPQQMDGRPPQASDDIYALGATLYELLTSKPPFHSGDVLHQARNFTPDPPEQRLADFGITNPVPADVSALILACLAKEPGQRPPGAAAVGAWIGLDLARQSSDSIAALPSGESWSAPAAGAEAEPTGQAEYSSANSNETPWWHKPWVLGTSVVAAVAVLIACGALIMAAKRKRAAPPVVVEQTVTNATVPTASAPATPNPPAMVPLQLYWSDDRSAAVTSALVDGEAQAQKRNLRPAGIQGLIFTNPKPDTVPLKRYYNDSRRDNMVIATAQARTEAETAKYKLIAIEGYVFDAPRPGTIPLKLFWSAKLARNLTLTSAEAEAIARAAGYTFVRNEGYIFPAAGQPMAGAPTTRWTNGLGMVFVPLPGTAVRFSIWETRNQDYAAYEAVTPKINDAWKNAVHESVPVSPDPNHPVVNVHWDEARKFARWLTDKEHKEGRLAAGQNYRLPTDLEWSAAVGLPPEPGEWPSERQTKGLALYPWGTQWPPPAGAGNLKDETAKALFKSFKVIDGYRDGFATTAPVGSFASSQHGLHDLSGNVSEWCEDRHQKGNSHKVVRGGGWDSAQDRLVSNRRVGLLPETRTNNVGFRLVLADLSALAAAPAETAPALVAGPGDYTFTTFAGQAGVFGTTDGKGPAAKLNDPQALAVDKADNLYFADTWTCLIRKITPAGEVITVAGGPRTKGSVDGPRSVARFNHPRAVAVDTAGNLYVTDTDSFTVRKISPSGVVSTLAGKAGVAGHADGKGEAARFRGLGGVAVSPTGIVYVADYLARAIRQIAPDGTVSTLAGNPAENSPKQDGLGSVARFIKPTGLTLGHDGNLYVSEVESGWIRKVTPEGMVTTLAGTGTPGSTDGSASQAQFHDPYALVLDRAGNLWIVDSGNHTVRKLTPEGVVSTLAGKVGEKGIADGVGTDAMFNTVRGLAFDSQGNLFVSDMNNRVIRKGVPGR